MNILLIIKRSHVDVMRLGSSIGARWPGGRYGFGMRLAQGVLYIVRFR